jgi:hypothetical protein
MTTLNINDPKYYDPFLKNLEQNTKTRNERNTKRPWSKRLFIIYYFNS